MTHKLRRVLRFLLLLVLAQDDFRQRERAPEPEAPALAPKLTRAPKAKTQPQPTYPPQALADGREADVTLQIDIDAEGRVTAAEVIKPAGYGFDEAAREAALTLTFEPAEVDGMPSPIRIEYLMRFRPPPKLEAAEDPPAGDAAPAPTTVPQQALPPPQEIVARGQLREKGTRDPIPAADVVVSRLDGTQASEIGHVVTSTDEEGRFEVEATPGGRVRLVISSSEHEPCIRDLDLPRPGAQALTIDCLVPRSRGPRYETVIKTPPQGEEVTRHSLSRPELTTVPGTFGDPLRVIQNLPGIARSPYGLGLLIIRGSSPVDSGVYVDGHRVPLLYHFLGGPSVLTPDLIERIDFFPGGFGVRYGRMSAGVIDVATRAESINRTHGSADVDFIDASAHLEGPLGNGFTGEAAARRSYVDALLPFVIPEEEGSSTAVVSPVYYDYQARVSRPVGSSGRLSLFAFGSDDNLKVITTDPARGDIDLGTRVGFHRLIGSYSTTFAGWTSRLSPSYGYDLARFSAGEVDGDLSAHVFGLREDLTRTVLPSLKLAAGFDGELRLDRIDFQVPLPPERRSYGRTTHTLNNFQRDLTDIGAGAYLETLWDAHRTLRVVPGLRFDWFHINRVTRTSLDPRLVVRWQRTQGQAFKMGAGLFHQAPQPQEVDTEFGNPDLPLLWADQYHAGIEQQLTRALALDVTVYFLRRHNLPIASSQQDATGQLRRYTSDGRGRGYGLELHLKHALTENFFGWISYTLSRSEIATLMPTTTGPSPPYHPTQFDQTHNFVLVASRKLGTWELGARFRLSSGIPETPIYGGTYDADFDEWDGVMGETFSARRQLFHQLDLRVERTWTFDVWRMSAYLDVQNVYNAENPEATLYDYRYQSQAPLRGLPVLPILGVRGRF